MRPSEMPLVSISEIRGELLRTKFHDQPKLSFCYNYSPTLLKAAFLRRSAVVDSCLLIQKLGNFYKWKTSESFVSEGRYLTGWLF